MPKRQPPWFVRHDPADADYAFFVSHVAEDAQEVAQLKAEIEAYSSRGGRPSLRSFFDLHSWPLANVNTSVIRDCLLRSSFMLAWITPGYLASTRGWVWIEFAYAELMELSRNLDRFDLARPYIVPVFRRVGLPDLERTPLIGYWQRQLVQPGQSDEIEEIARKLVDFYDQEMRKT